MWMLPDAHINSTVDLTNTFLRSNVGAGAGRVLNGPGWKIQDHQLFAARAPK